MPHLRARSWPIVDCVICSIVAAATAVAVLFAGPGGAVLLLGPEGAAESAIAQEVRLSR